MTNLYAFISISAEYHAFEITASTFCGDDAVGYGHFGMRLAGIQILAMEIYVQHEADLHVLHNTTQICLLIPNWYYSRLKTGPQTWDISFQFPWLALGDSSSAIADSFPATVAQSLYRVHYAWIGQSHCNRQTGSVVPRCWRTILLVIFEGTINDRKVRHSKMLPVDTSGQVDTGAYAGAARRRVHLATEHPWPPCGHRPGRRQARHARIPLIVLQRTLRVRMKPVNAPLGMV